MRARLPAGLIAAAAAVLIMTGAHAFVVPAGCSLLPRALSTHLAASKGRVVDVPPALADKQLMVEQKETGKSIAVFAENIVEVGPCTR